MHNIGQAVEKAEEGVLQISNKTISFQPNQNQSENFQTQIHSNNNWEYKEQIGVSDQLYIFGGGHVGLALSQIFSMLDFHISIFDDREFLNTLNDNQYANVKKIINYENIEDIVPEGMNTYVVVMTAAHKHDEMVVHQLISKKVKYLGMMGSKKKVKTIFDKFHAQGIDSRLTARIDAPIGLKIGSETPAEIAISIAAKIISVRHQ